MWRRSCPVDALGSAGSVAIDDLEVDSQVNFKNATFNVADLDVDSKNESQVINVAGEVAISGSSTIGLALALNSVDNAASINAVDSTFNREGGKADLTATNTGDLYAVGAGINISTMGGMNTMKCTTIYTVVGTTADLDNVTDVKLKNALDQRYSTTEIVIVGALPGHFVLNGLIGIILVNDGAAIAYSAMPDNYFTRRIRYRSTIKNSTLTTVDFVADYITIQRESAEQDAADIDYITDEWIVCAQGGAAVAQLVEKDVDAVAVNNSIIDALRHRYRCAIRRGSFTIGRFLLELLKRRLRQKAVAVAVNKINQDTDAKLSGGSGTQNIDNGSVNANSNANILSVAGSGALTLSSSAILTAAGSGSYNYIGSNTNAAVDNAKMPKVKHYGVVARIGRM